MNVKFDLKEFIKENMPDFFDACEESGESMIFSHDAFENNEAGLVLMGCVIKYACMKGKTVNIVPESSEILAKLKH